MLVHLHWWHALPQAASSLHDVLLPVVTEAVPQLLVGCPGEGTFVLLQRTNARTSTGDGHGQSASFHHLFCF